MHDSTEKSEGSLVTRSTLPVSLIEAVKLGRLLVVGVDGSEVELWDPQELRWGEHRAKVRLTLSASFPRRVPVPPRPNAHIYCDDFVGVGKPFSIVITQAGWAPARLKFDCVSAASILPQAGEVL